jgi:hypothetical protein
MGVQQVGGADDDSTRLVRDDLGSIDVSFRAIEPAAAVSGMPFTHEVLDGDGDPGEKARPRGAGRQEER